MKRHKQRTLFLSAIGFSILTRASYLLANPQAPTVIAGSAVFNVPDPSTLHVTTSEQAIINWNGFSIASGELTQFIQPSANSAVLNRVTGGDMSAIMGALKANGRVYLINPNGILFGKDAVINANSFVASTLDVDNNEFLQNGDLLFSGDNTASIINLGTITADNGDVILIGYTVDNQGEINAPEGGVRAFAGQELILHKDGDEKITIRVKTPAGEAEGTGVNQAGTINAVTAELKADGNLYNLAINHSGTTDAKGIVKHNGQVFLYAQDGLGEITGNISAKNADGTGGTVHVLGDELSLPRRAKIDVSGDNGGGTVLIGGDYQGRNENIPNASHVYIGKETRVDASANQEGDAGKVVVWADKTTIFYGNIEATGGNISGDGGLAEVSGKQYLDYNGVVDLRAENGNTGHLLLDPTNLAISTNANNDVANLVAGPNFYPDTSGSLVSNLNNITLQNALGSANITVQTGADGGVGAGDINWATGAPVSPGSAFNLTIESANDLNIGSNYSNAGGGSVYFQAKNNLNLEAPITLTTSQPIILEAGNDLNVIATNIVNSSGGSISLTAGNTLNVGYPSQGVSTNIQNSGTDSSTISLTGREINVYGEPAAITNIGFSTTSSPIAITSTGGNINISGNASIQSNYGIDLHAYNGDIHINSIDSSVAINANLLATNIYSNTSLNAYQGDIIIENGATTIFAPNDVTLNAPIGSIEIYGKDTASANANSVLITSANGTANLIAGENVIATAGINSPIVVNGNNKVDIDVGGDLRLNANGLAGATQSQVSIASGTGTQINIGNDLILTAGGSAALGSPNAYAQITNAVSGDVNLTVGNDVILQGGISPGSYALIENGGPGLTSVNAGGNVHLIAGTATSTFAQIGAVNTNSRASIDVTAGQDITLDSSAAPNINSYAIIGHALPPSAATPGSFTGNISVTGGPSTDINLIGGPLTFAQIGHAGSLVNNVASTFPASDILVNHIGGDINFNPNAGYAAIGHGNNVSGAGNVGSITGNITVSDVGGNVNLNPGTGTNSFAQIGHYNAGIITGDINVSAEGNVNLETGSFAGNSSIIGQGNRLTPNLAGISSNIQVNAKDVNLLAGNNVTVSNGPTIIGFSTGQTVLAIDPNSTISVHAQEDVTVQAGWSATAGIVGGNAVIGFISPSSVASRINHIDVTADSGNIDVYGGSNPAGAAFAGGAALIGTTTLTSLAPFAESDVSVNAPNGQISVVGLTPGLPVTNPGVLGGGLAAITNQSQASAYDVTINARDVLVAASDQPTLPFPSNAFITSGRNVTANVDDDLRVLGGAGFARISALGGPATFDVGGNVQVVARGGPAQIGNNVATPIDCPINFTNVGGSVLVQGGTSPSAYAEIGHGQGTTAGNSLGEITFSHIGANVVVQGGSGASLTFAQIGHSGNAGTLVNAFGDVLLQDVVGNVNVNGGSAPIASATIGHSNPTVSATNDTFVGEVHVKANSAYIVGGSGSESHAVIGYSTVSSAAGSSFTSQLVNVELNGVAELTSNTQGNAVIGYYAPGASPNSVTIRNINVEAIDGNVQLTGGSGGSAAIGTVSSNASATSQIKVTTNKDVVLTGGTTPQSVATIANANSSVANANDVIIDPSSIILLANAGSANIYSSGNLNLSYNDSFYINYDALNPSVLQNGPASVIAQRNINVNIDNESVGDLVLQGGSTGIGNFARMRTLLGDVVIGTKNHTGAGNVTIGTAAQVAPADIEALTGNVFINGFGELNIIGSLASAIGDSTLLANGKLEVIFGGDVNVIGGAGEASIVTSNGTIDLISGASVTVGQNGSIQNDGATGEIKIDAEEDVSLSANATINNAGDGQTIVNAGQDLKLANSATIVNVGSGDIITSVGRDTVLTETSSISAQDGGNFINTSGRDFTLEDATAINTNGESDMSITAGRDIALSTTAALNHLGTGQLSLDAGDSLTLDDNSHIFSNGDIHVKTGQDTVLSDTASIRNLLDGQTTFDLGRDLVLNNAASITNAGSGDILIDAERDTILSGTTNITAIGGGNIIDHSGRNVTLSDAAHFNSFGDSLMTVTAGNSITLTDTSAFNHTSTGILTLDAGLDISMSGNSTVVSQGDVHTSAAQDTTLSGGSFITVTQGGDFTNKSGRDFTMTGTSNISTNGHSLMTIDAGNTISLSDSTALAHNSTGILTMNAGVDIVLNDNAIVTSRGDVNTTAGQDTVLNDSSIINLTNGGDFTNQSARNFVMNDASVLSTNQDGNIDIDAGHSILLSGTATIQHSSTGTMNLTAVEDVALSNNAIVRTNAGNINIKAGQDTTLIDTSAIYNLGNGQTTVDSGRDISLNQQGSITNVGSGDILTQAGRDTTLAGASQIVAQGGGNFANESGRNFTMTGTSIVRTNGSSQMTVEAGKNISLSDDAFLNHNSTGILTLTAGEDILVSDTADINTRGDLYAKAGQDMILSQSADVVNLENGETNISVVRDFRMRNRSTLINEGSGDITIDAGRDTRMSGSTLIEADDGGNFYSKSGRDFKMQGSSKIETDNNSLLIVDAAREIELEDRAYIDHDAHGILCLTACEDLKVEDNATVRTEHGDGHLEAGRDIHIEDAGRVLAEGARPLELLAGYDIRVIDNAIVANSGTGDLTMIADHNMDLLNNAMVTTNGGNLHLVVDNDWPCCPDYGTGRIFKDRDVTISTNGGALRIFTSVRGFNTIRGLLNGIPLFPEVEFVNTPLEQWGTYYLQAFNGHPFTIFYKNCGVPQRPINPSVVNNFRIATNEGFYDWRVVDQFLFGLDYFTEEYCAPTDCCNPCEDDGNAFVRFYRFLRKKYLNYHTKQLDQL